MISGGVKRAFGHAISDIGMIMLIILMSGMIGFAIIFMQVPQQIAGALLSGLSNPQSPSSPSSLSASSSPACSWKARSSSCC